MKFKISREANRDIESIWLYTFQNWSLKQADYYINSIFDEIEFLAKNPSFGQNYSDVIPGYFRSRIKSHYIFYKINPLNKEIEIIRILHERMDIKSRLS